MTYLQHRRHYCLQHGCGLVSESWSGKHGCVSEAAPPAEAVYVVRAVDTSGNVSAPSTVTPAAAALP
jgi:hypothetical protein